MSPYSDRRYLASKKTVDDRALNKDVLARLRTELSLQAESPVRVLEIGGGLGTMVARLVDWNVLPRADYELVDADAHLLDDARDWLAAWAKPTGYVLDDSADGVRIRSACADVSLTFVRAEIGEYLNRDPASPPADGLVSGRSGSPPADGLVSGRSGSPPADLLIANAFMDLVDVPTVLPGLLRRVAPGGLCWFSINYDGETILLPEHSDDATFMRVYNRSMDERIRFGRPAGDSKTGRRMFHHLARAGATVLAAGASDWVVHPQARESPASGNAYEADEEYFLHHIIHTIEEELERHAEIEPQALSRWGALRHDQARRGELVYVAHQLDFVARCAGKTAP